MLQANSVYIPYAFDIRLDWKAIWFTTTTTIVMTSKLNQYAASIPFFANILCLLSGKITCDSRILGVEHAFNECKVGRVCWVGKMSKMSHDRVYRNRVDWVKWDEMRIFFRKCGEMWDLWHFGEFRLKISIPSVLDEIGLNGKKSWDWLWNKKARKWLQKATKKRTLSFSFHTYSICGGSFGTKIYEPQHHIVVKTKPGYTTK